VDAHDHPVHSSSLGGYEIKSEWLTQFWFRLAREHRTIRAQVHTHPGDAFHSSTDDHWPVVSQPGFLSIVIPNFAKGPVSLKTTWIGRLEANGHWRSVPMESAITMVS
jgi:hypothetical protein